MAYILHIETSNINCSIAISKDDQLLSIVEKTEANIHASKITLFTEEACKLANIRINDLDAVAVSKGPGSYTGLRIGVSTAKGICYALDIPLIAVDTLKVLSRAALENYTDSNCVYIPMIDARRMEVYTKVYDVNLNIIQETEALILDDVAFKQFEKFSKKVVLFGDGAEKTKALNALSDCLYLDILYPSSKYMIKDVYEDYLSKNFEDVAYFEPNYLKEFYFAKKQTE